MRKYLLRALGLGSLIAVLIAGGGYYAYAQSATPEAPNLELSAEAAGAWLGIVVAPSSDPAGVKVVKVLKDGPAAKAGVQVGDVITAVAGVSIANPAGLRAEIEKYAPGQSVILAVTRAGAALDPSPSVTLEAVPAKPQRPDRPAKPGVRPGAGAMPFMPGIMHGGFENNVSGSFTRLEGEPKVKVVYDVTFGIVTVKTADSVTIDPNGSDPAGPASTFTITGETKTRGDVNVGDKAVVIRKDGKLAALMAVREPQKRENRTEGNRGENKDKKRVHEFYDQAFSAFPAMEALERFPALREKLEMHMPALAERFALEFVH